MLKKISYGIVVVCLTGIVLWYQGLLVTHVKPGRVILLDGTSSVGKSAIIGEFKKLHPEYAIIKVDDWFPLDLTNVAQVYGWAQDSHLDPWTFVRNYLIEKNKTYYLDTEVRREMFASMPTRGYFEAAKKESLQGDNVIIDTVLEDMAQYQLFDKTFQGLPVTKVLVYCPLDILLERVEKRNASHDISEHRTAFLSFEQFPVMYKVQASANELLVDTVKTETMRQALDKAVQDLVATGIAEGYVLVLAQFKQRFVDHFELDTREDINLAPARAYDLVINSGVGSPSELAGAL